MGKKIKCLADFEKKYLPETHKKRIEQLAKEAKKHGNGFRDSSGILG